MYKVYFWDAHKNGLTAFINVKQFTDKAKAKVFNASVSGVLKGV